MKKLLIFTLFLFLINPLIYGGQKNLYWTKGDTETTVFSFLDSNKAAYDITDKTFTFQVGTDEKTSDIFIATGNSFTLDTNKAILEVSTSDTNQDLGRYFWDAFFVDGAGKKSTFGSGALFVTNRTGGYSNSSSTIVGTTNITVEMDIAYGSQDNISLTYGAAGDIPVGTGSATYNMLAIGINGQVLTVDTSEPTKTKWSSAGAGDVIGPSSASDNAVARFDTTTGKLVQNSTVSIDDNGSINIPSGQAYQINGTAITATIETLTNKTLTTPTIGDFTNATHSHENNAGGGQIDHTTALTNVGSNSHAAIDTHIASSNIHFTEASIDHTAITNVGSNSHDTIDTHIASANIHFQQSAISITASQVSDFDTEVGNNTDVAANTTHRTSDGSDHGFINQNVTTTGGPTFASGNITGDFTVDTDTLYVDAANNRVGIGLSSPLYRVHIADSGAATTMLYANSTSSGNAQSLVYAQGGGYSGMRSYGSGATDTFDGVSLASACLIGGLSDASATVFDTVNGINSKMHFATESNIRMTIDSAGVATFTKFPVGPSTAPTTDYQMANKKYVDDNIAAGGMTSFDIAGDSGTPQTITNGNTVTISGGGGVVTTAQATDTIAITVNSTLITAHPAVSIDSADYILFSDTDDSGNLRKSLVSGLPSSGFTSFDVSANSGTTQTILDGQELILIGGTGITAVVGATDTVTFNTVDGEIDHDSLLNYVAGQHFTEASIDHTAITNIGTNSHAAIDTHISSANIHFTQASITTVGTIGTGTWQGTAVADTYVANDLTISGGTIENTPIGTATPSTGKFTTFEATTINATVISATQNIVSSQQIYGGSADSSPTTKNITIDWNNELTSIDLESVGANIDITLSNVTTGNTVAVKFQQGATARQMNSITPSVIWQGGTRTTPNITSTENYNTLVTFTKWEDGELTGNAADY